jgi:membrane-associated phospholipid phosphatase
MYFWQTGCPNLKGLVCGASDENSTRTEVSHALLASLFFSCAAIILTFIGLLQFDVPLTRYVRSLNDFQMDHLHNPWLAQLSDVGDQLGRGESLIYVSVGLLVVGYGLKRSVWKSAGWETLLAHALSGLINNALKHVIGRARPKFMHAGNPDFAPLAGSGWDSFPSGHSMAAFAVATVLAVKFPKARWPVMLLALAIAVSRMIRGSHYLTDVAGGAMLGVLVGALSAHPWKDWRASLASALWRVTPPFTACLVFMTTVGYPLADDWSSTVLRSAGFVIVLVALIINVLIRTQTVLLPSYVTRPLGLALIGLGIGMFTGSPWVASVMLLTSLAYWVRKASENSDAICMSHPPWPYEAAFGIAVILSLYTMIELRGVLPIG